MWWRRGRLGLGERDWGFGEGEGEGMYVWEGLEPGVGLKELVGGVFFFGVDDGFCVVGIQILRLLSLEGTEGGIPWK